MSSLEWRLEYARSAYAEEVNAMHRIRDRVSYVVGFSVTPAVSFWFYICNNYPENYLDLQKSLLFLLIISVPTVLLGMAFVKLLWLMGREYNYDAPPLPSELSEAFHKCPDKQNPLDAVKAQLITSLESAVNNNTKLNLQRNSVLIAVQKLCIWALPLLLVCAFISAWQAHGKNAAPLRVKIVDQTIAGTLKP
jgi:hypothetical protein